MLRIRSGQPVKSCNYGSITNKPPAKQSKDISFGRVSNELLVIAQELTNPQKVLEIIKLNPKLAQYYYDAKIPPMANLAGLKEANSGHSARMADAVPGTLRHLSKKFRAGLDEQVLRVSALLHDTGKIGIPPEILGKNGELTPEERQIIQIHTELGRAILESAGLGRTKEGRAIIANVGGHHQNPMGTGYASNAEFTPGAQVISGLDKYDAIRNKRCYHAENSRTDTLAIIKGSFVDKGELHTDVYQAVAKSTQEGELTAKKTQRKSLYQRLIYGLSALYSKRTQTPTSRLAA